MKIANLSAVPTQGEPRERAYFWDVMFRIGDVEYAIKWSLASACVADVDAANCPAADGAFTPGVARCQLLIVPPGEDGIPQSDPTCTHDRENSTLHAIFPEAVIGDPGHGVLFTDMRILTGAVLAPFTGRVEGRETPTGDGARYEDEGVGERYAFALGGPAVWSIHNPRLDPLAPAWYTRPLAAENVADSIQVVGALLALATFLGGLLLVARRRRRVRALLAEVDSIVRTNRRDAHRGLLQLGDLEEAIDARLARRRVTESEYQIVSQRIATAATRLAMRRELGLDDGEPDVPPLPRAEG